ncbi:MAG: helix-turn-helix domain-containing protein, partial [Gloeomargarita sp. SKYG98]|nr:helix-turn-helix domain-containing protein [Gloeomargarita sp. SKYG98]
MPGTSHQVRYFALSTTRNGWSALGQLIRECRNRRGWTLEELMEQLEQVVYKGKKPPISKATLSNIERGAHRPTLDVLLALVALQFIEDDNGKPM